jgi:hypothetical protein
MSFPKFDSEISHRHASFADASLAVWEEIAVTHQSDDASPENVDEAEAIRLLDAVSALLESVQDETLREILEETCCDLAELLPEESDECDEDDEFEDDDDHELAA